MAYRIAADTVVLLHLAFIFFVVLGGVIVLKLPKVMWAHLPAVVWGACVELAGWVCPLTPLENSLRIADGDSGYSGGFIESYLIPVVYPSGLSRSIQLLLGVAVVVINLVWYGLLVARRWKIDEDPRTGSSAVDR